MKHRHKATVPAAETKTRHDYFWLLPDEMADFVSYVEELPHTGFPNFRALNRALGPYYDKQVLKESGVRTSDRSGNSYTMRTIRAARATEWVLLQQEYEVMQWEPHPPNPLQHTNKKMTLAKYATKGSENKWDAKRRCVEKYGGNPDLKQEWMNEWLKMAEANKRIKIS